MTEPADIILVPVTTRALVVSNAVRYNQDFARWNLRFAPGTRTDPQESADHRPDIGVFLHWQLPDALCRGRVDLTKQGQGQGQPFFPTAPNRWVVVRYHRPHPVHGAPLPGPAATGWLIHSDYASNHRYSQSHRDGGTSPYLRRTVGQGNDWQVCYIGAKHDLSIEEWNDPGQAPGFLLTAVGPGIPTFASYQPYNENVFSLHDPLNQPGNDTKIDEALVSYLVVGWHSRPEDSPLHPHAVTELLRFHGTGGGALGGAGRPVDDALAALGWAVKGASDTARPLYVGTVLGLDWKLKGEVPPSRRPLTPWKQSLVSTGHSSADALDAVVDECLPGDLERRRQRAQLLHAFHTGLLDVLDNSTVASPEALDAALRTSWFHSSPGGFTWRLTPPRTQDGVPPARQTDFPELRAALRKLNTLQHDCDRAEVHARAALRRWYELWWMSGLDGKPADFMARAVAPAQQAAAAARSDALAKRDQLPQFVCAVQQLLPSGWAVDKLPGAPFYRPAEPVALAYPMGLPPELRLDNSTPPLPCRTPAQILTRAQAPSPPLIPPEPCPAPAHFASLQKALLQQAGARAWETVGRLLGEFWVLDAYTAELLRKGTPRPSDYTDAMVGPGPGQTLPAGAAPWNQPWDPMYLRWSAYCYPVPVVDSAGNSTGYWSFTGTSHRLTAPRKDLDPIGKNPDPYTVQGCSHLSPVPIFTLQKRVAQYLDTYPDTKANEVLHEFRKHIGNWDMISQELTGVNDWFVQRTPFYGDASADAPPGATLTPVPVPPDPHKPVPFTPVLAGQLSFAGLAIVDRFGQLATVVDSTNQQSFRPRTGRDLHVECQGQTDPDVDPPVSTTDAQRFVSLRPRLPQPARLCFEPLSVGSDGIRPIDPDADPTGVDETPACGWILPRAHGSGVAQRALAVYGPRGQALGEVRLVGPAGKEAVGWVPLPGSPFLRPSDITGAPFKQAYPDLYGLLSALVDPDADHASGRTERADRFQALTAAIDIGVPTVAPPTDPETAVVSLLVGRPLVLVRTRLRLELDGPPLPDSSWATAMTAPGPATHPLWKARWNIQLGSPHDLTDGLFGYYTAASAAPGDKAIDYQHLCVGYEIVPEPVYLRTVLHGEALSVAARSAGQPADDTAAAFATLLMDPWSSVEAKTGILPAAKLRLPDGLVNAALRGLSLSLPQAPLLAPLRPPGADHAHAQTTHKLVLPYPLALDKTGRTAVWTERTTDGKWHTLPLVPADGTAHPLDPRPTARSGYLSLIPDSHHQTPAPGHHEEKQ
ncbi:hypothetical protein [Streptomyces sp. YGL11-2]|uniref:hypothetical protein n=1 Tax=Streptomyces sp. YGL11-2 TaxID=3414028 RepID=UPI003CFB59F1